MPFISLYNLHDHLSTDNAFLKGDGNFWVILGMSNQNCTLLFVVFNLSNIDSNLSTLHLSHIFIWFKYCSHLSSPIFLN